MPFEVSLLKLVTLPGSASIWPDDFKAFDESLKESISERTAWGAGADWLDEHGEPELAEVYRTIALNLDVVIEQHEWAFQVPSGTAYMGTGYLVMSSDSPPSRVFRITIGGKKWDENLSSPIAVALSVKRWMNSALNKKRKVAK